MTAFSLAADCEFENPQAWLEFLNENDREHRKWYKKAQSLGVPYDRKPLADVSQSNRRAWLQDHQQDHVDVCRALGLTPPPDFSDVNFEDPDDFADWMLTHKREHLRVDPFI